MSDFQRIVVATPPAPAPEGHEERMTAVAEGKAAPTATPAEPAVERPAWLPEKFKTVEDLAASYKELEAKQGKPAAEETPKPAAEKLEVPAADKPPAAGDVAAAVSKAGLDLGSLYAEYDKAGTVSAESYTKLEAAGFDKATVDGYIAGQQALADRFAADVRTATPGGAEKYGDMMAWAKANLSDAEKGAYNEAMGSGSAEKAKLAVAGLGARFSADVGNEPNLTGGRPNAGPTDVFESIAQMKAAMRDPRYKTDVAYRKAVGEKLGRSDIM